MNAKRYLALSLAIALIVAVASYSLTTTANSLVVAQPECCSENCVVDKTQGQTFTVKICFKNTGGIEGSWSVNVAFEGDLWVWTGCAQNVTLKAGETKALIWAGSVPCDAPNDSMGRLVVYYDDSFTALNWWVHVVPNAELSISSSCVW